MKTMIRCTALDMSGLAAQEAHGKRLDGSSRLRKIRDVSPLVYGSLDLRDRYDRHMDGVKQNRGAKKPVLHFLVRFPPDVLDGDQVGRFVGTKAERQKMMLRQAAAFVNRTHGGQAVFAARIDRDEAGETIVDVFAAPKYEKRTKRTKPDESGPTWASATKFGKELAEKHQDELRRRHPEAKGKLTGPRHVGIALNTEWRSFFQSINKLTLDEKIEKTSGAPDRLETEAYKTIQAARREAQEIHDQVRIEARALDRMRRRITTLVAALGETIGIPLPKRLSEAVDALEREAAQRPTEPVDPFTEDHSVDVGPSL